MTLPTATDVLELLLHLDDSPQSREAIAGQAIQWLSLYDIELNVDLVRALVEIAKVNEIDETGAYLFSLKSYDHLREYLQDRIRSQRL